MRIPSTISSTTVGRTIRRWSLDRIAPALAAARTRTSDPASGSGASAATGMRAITRDSEGESPHVLVNEPPGSSRITASPVRNAFGGQVMGSTARLRRLTSGSGSPVNSIRYP